MGMLGLMACGDDSTTKSGGEVQREIFYEGYSSDIYADDAFHAHTSSAKAAQIEKEFMHHGVKV